MIALLLLALAPPGLAKKPRPEAPEAPAPATMSDAEVGALFAEVAKAAATGNRSAAADQLAAIVTDPSKAPAHGQAWAMLAKSFLDFELKLPAVVAWGKALALKPEAAAPELESILELARQTGETAPVAESLGKNLGIQVDDPLRNQVSYLAARYHVHEGNLGPATAILRIAKQDQPGFEDIELLRGVVLSLQGQPDDAVAPMQIAEALGRRNGRGDRFVNRANLNIARAYYAAGNYTQASVFYRRVERSSDFWLDAQFESAWAHFRGNDMNGALAMLFSHKTPFFEEGYFNPEADLLRAYALFTMCKFPDASKQIDEFQAKWEPIRDQYLALSLSPKEAFGEVRAHLTGDTSKLPRAMLRQFEHEDRMLDAVKAVSLAERELVTAQGVGGDTAALAEELLSELIAHRTTVEGQRILDRIAESRKELDQLLTDIEITRLDLLNLESEMYSRAAATGTLDYGDNIGQIRELRRRKGYRVWPFQGEYWADEVGWYVFNARPDCPESMARGDDSPR